MLVFQPSLRRITVVECGPLLTCRRAGPTRVVRRRGGRRALTSGLVDAASNRRISGSPIRSEHALEATRRVSSREVWSVDGGGGLVDVRDGTSGWCAVEVELELELEVLSPPLRLPGALASVRFLELPRALLVIPLHETLCSACWEWPGRRRAAVARPGHHRPVTGRTSGGREVMTHSWRRLASEVATCSPKQTPGRSWAPAPPAAA